MAANPVAYVHDGIVRIPEEVKADPRFQDGARLELVPVNPRMSSEEEQKAWDEFISLEGIMADSAYDANLELEKEKQRELAEEAGWRAV